MASGIAEKTANTFHVMALPFPGRGHINPMMNLCRSLASKKRHNIIISFVVTEEWLSLISSELKPDNIRFGCIPNVLTSERARAGKFPAFLEEVSTKMEAPVEQLLDRLDPPVTTIIADTNLPWAVQIANRRNIPVASLWTMSVPVYSVLHHFDLLVQNGHFTFDLKEEGEERVEYIPGISSIRIADLPMHLYGKGREILHRPLEAIKCVSKAQFLVLCSVYELESQAIDALRANISCPIYHVGPTIPYFKLQEETTTAPNDTIYLQWLDMQPKASVLYVSQGSTHSAPSAQLDEIAAGLRSSGVRYLWVARGETSQFKESCGDMGLVVPWCDQLRVLCHPSVGGFWSHCGWNSTLEAVFAGVPMLTFPLYWDQIPNSKMIVEDWKIGWRVKSEMDADRLLITREEIAGLIKRFMDNESNEGKELRRKARELSEISRKAIQEDGSSDSSINAFIDDISQ